MRFQFLLSADLKCPMWHLHATFLGNSGNQELTPFPPKLKFQKDFFLLGFECG